MLNLTSTYQRSFLQRNNSLPQLLSRPGQLLQGTVLREVREGKILANLQGVNVITSTYVPVTVGDRLLLRLKRIRPKPMFTVRQNLEAPGNTESVTLFSHLENFWQLRIPITEEQLAALNTQRLGLSAKKFIPILLKNPGFWRRILYHLTIKERHQFKAVQTWIQASKLAFDSGYIQELYRQYPAQFHPVQQLLNTNPNQFSIQSVITQDLSGEVRAELGSIYDLFSAGSAMQRFYWEAGRWWFGCLPLMYQEQPGLIGFSWYQVKSEATTNPPAQLNILGVFGNGMTLQGKIEYRDRELSGAIDVNNKVFERSLQQELRDTYYYLERTGYKNPYIRIQTITTMIIRPEKLIPVPVTNQTLKA